ncbi:MAG: SDR family oxidoreductase [Deltaproteobacteria bacterium]|nr:SDR family oxidoreductase [Deltaproteobacteria bacterium]
MDLALKDKVGIVTGAGWGMGKAIAEGLAEEGARVVVADIDEARGIAATKQIVDSGGEATFVRADVSRWSEVQQVVSAALERFEHIDILVNNAGAWVMESFAKMQRESWDIQINVNYYGTLNFTKAVLDHMISRKTGCIISIGSDAARIGEPTQTIYSGTKAAILAFTRSLAKEVGRYGIRVNAVCPSLTRVERRVEMEESMRREDPAKFEAYQEQMKKALRLYPLGKFGAPQDVANMVVFLASDLRAGHITGQTISVNGGYCMV